MTYGRASEPEGRASEQAGRALDLNGRSSEQARRASEEAAALGEPRIKLGGLRFPYAMRSSYRKLQRWEGLGSSRVSLGASWEGLRASQGGTEKKK